MVIVNFRLSEIGRVVISLNDPEKWETLVQRCAARSAIELGTILAVRRGRLLQGDDLVADGDEIEVFPALSGG
ncbi:MAG: hypothetical protein A2X81_10465 [Desulfobacterales bacterium GWB2_56_26]|nr:MAG: hypothetical protein A2X81_10465 [Desulfobacterales bacterium GWB2_56_26]